MNRLTTVLVSLLGAVLALAVVGLGAAGGWQYWNHVQLNGEQQTAAELPDLAKAEIPQILGYEFSSVQRTTTQALTLMTPEFRKRYEELTAKNNIFNDAVKRKLISQVNVVGAGMISSHRDAGSVLAFVNRVITDERKQPNYEGSRLRVDYRKIDGKWLIDEMTPIF
ncbi:tetratricopeptide repeat protein [Mycobacterium sp. CBMA293]|uniref:mammalian cell entry protein n=1 Tax=unclassified Mycolicibacterium TaxID=2636767 RepID=UPI0012DC9BD7|nr:MULTISPECIES: mammalian cell entry protein [unclassified Mycolicibacterium]MUL44376.1 tetratricopeptide repeat protein [Mycolicibacterium sp. CBMA 360]MUL59694.1 tetratricopeptide repeat protein [Mycolicibacterium sp. CBMA 335]MUL68537.1 tetratricopeptide repeat protein [Mycolicibacterium sp. CBMA 311]MUL97190.1 tetratricopeptide repeat protein [Mycolicibacterium sp. CBMA 230]MUM06318.1 mammalian cell entry protein [Mycolicibacterium sp. CBMA 213]